MKKFILYTIGFFAIFAGMGYWTLKNFDEKIRPELIEEIRKETGRSLTVSGEAKLNFSLSPSVTITDLKISNPSWFKHPHMVEVGKIDIGVSLWHLIWQKVKITHFVLDDTQIMLLVAGDGRNNWTFAQEEKKAVQPSVPADVQAIAKAEKKAKHDGDDRGIKGLKIDNLVFQNARVVFNDEQKQMAYQAEIEQLNLSETEDGVNVEAKIKLRNEDFILSGSFASFDNLFKDDVPYPFTVQLSGADTTAMINGTIHSPLKAQNITASVAFDTSRLSDFTSLRAEHIPFEKMSLTAQIAGTPDNLSYPSFDLSLGRADTVLIKAAGAVEKIKPLTMAAQVEAKITPLPSVNNGQQVQLLPTTLAFDVAVADKAFRLFNVAGISGKSSFSGEAAVSLKDSVSVRAVFRSSMIDLADLIKNQPKLASVQAQSPGVQSTLNSGLPQEISSKRPKKLNRGKVFSKESLPFDKLKAANIDISVDIQKLVAANSADLGAVKFSATMHNGIFSLSDFKISNFLTANASLNASSGQTANVNGTLKVQNMPMGLFFAGIPKGAVNADIRIKGQGNSSAAIAASAIGRVFVYAKDMHVVPPKTEIEAPQFLQDFVKKLEQPFDAACFVVNTPIANGVISTPKRIALESEIVKMQVDGNIDLGKETVDLAVNMSPQTDGLLEAMFSNFKMSGSLNSPNVQMDSDKSLDKIIAIGLSFFQGGRGAAKQAAKQDQLQDVCNQALTGK